MNKDELKLLSNNIDIGKIYYQFFFNKSNTSFKSFIYFSTVIKKIKLHPELINSLNKLKEIENNLDKKSYIIHNIDMFRFMTKLDDDYFDSFNVLLLLLSEFENKEFFFNGIYNEGIDEYKINKNLKFLIELYFQQDYDLNTEKEFSHYKLIEISTDRKLFWQEPRIIDEKYQITFDIKYIDKSLYKSIFNLYKLQRFKLSFYPNCLNMKNYIDNSSMAFDSKEFGKPYNLDDCKKMDLKENIKFIDYVKEDKLYIKLFENNLTFEEIQKNPNNFNDLDLIYTKVVHLIFFQKNNILYIEHIDLEYIFYSLNEYTIRFEDNKFEQKGTKVTRQKIFKIDNAKINLTENLYDLVFRSLTNKNLVDEYFEMLNKL